MGIIIGIFVSYLYVKHHIKLVWDEKPKTNTQYAKAMKLSNEIAEYVKEDEDKIYLKIWAL